LEWLTGLLARKEEDGDALGSAPSTQFARFDRPSPSCSPPPFRFVCDWYAIVAVFDQMLQAIEHKEGTGFLAYAKDAPDGYLVKMSAW